MVFTSVTSDTNCTCLDGAKENYKDFFARKIDKKDVREKDFMSYWESKKFPDNMDDCNEVCGRKGISVDLWNDESNAEVMSKYIKTFGIAPQLKRFIMVFKMNQDAGIVKHTPHQKSGFDKYHYDIFKCDAFDMGIHISVSQINPIAHV